MNSQPSARDFQATCIGSGRNVIGALAGSSLVGSALSCRNSILLDGSSRITEALEQLPRGHHHLPGEDSQTDAEDIVETDHMTGISKSQDYTNGM